MQALQEPAALNLEGEAHQALGAGDFTLVLTLLMRAYGRALHRYCWGMLRNEHMAEDILQTVFIQAFEGLAAYQGRSTFRTWLFGIARHRCLDEADRRRRWARLVDEGTFAPDEVRAPAATDGDAELRGLVAHLDGCLEHLPRATREVVLLRFQQDLSYEEIAEITGDAAGALRVRLCRSLTVVRGCLEEKGVSL